MLISGLTVMTAMSGMYLAGAADFASYATGTIVVVAMAMLGSLTVLPALLSKLGDRDQQGPRARCSDASRPAWPGSTSGAASSTGCCGARCSRRWSPAGCWWPSRSRRSGCNLAEAGDESLPQDMEVVQTINRVKDAFPSEGVSTRRRRRGRGRHGGSGRRRDQPTRSETAKQKNLFTGSLDIEISPDKSVAIVSIPTAGDGDDAASNNALDELRDDLVPATLGQVDGVEANVSGGTAQTRDFVDSMKSHLPYVFAFVLGAAFLLLLVTFRSIVIPIKAIVLNLLSVGAAYGVLVLVFQNEWAEGLLDFNSSGAIAPWLPLFMFVILFGLSMDYHVFILTRVREAYDGGMSTENAVSHAIKGTAGVVTSAAVVMVGVFSIFATLSLLDFKQMGIGLAAAVLIDATIIRGVLLPATMKLLGDWNWYLPRRLQLAAPGQGRRRGATRQRIDRTRHPSSTRCPPPRRAPARSEAHPNI